MLSVVAGVAYRPLPGFDWPPAFLIGVIVSPPDAVAVTAITQSLGLPRRVATTISPG